MKKVIFYIAVLLLSTSFGTEYEGLVLLKRYALQIETSKLCEDSRLHLENPISISSLPTDRSINIVDYVLKSNSSAIVFDFESPSLGLGNCLLGFIQTFHWAVLSGLPLFIAQPEKGTALAVCWFFECGFPLINVDELDTLGARR